MILGSFFLGKIASSSKLAFVRFLSLQRVPPRICTQASLEVAAIDFSVRQGIIEAFFALPDGATTTSIYPNLIFNFDGFAMITEVRRSCDWTCSDHFQSELSNWCLEEQRKEC